MVIVGGKIINHMHFILRRALFRGLVGGIDIDTLGVDGYLVFDLVFNASKLAKLMDEGSFTHSLVSDHHQF